MTDGEILEVLGRVRTRHEHFEAEAEIRDDGRINVQFRDKHSKLANYLEKRARHSRLGQDLTKHNNTYEAGQSAVLGRYEGIPKLNIAIQIVGSRGDVQPFIAIAKELQQAPYNHRVRICTHSVFKEFVEENGIEFFSIGGDPAVLMSYMVRNPGLIPAIETIKAGDVDKRRNDIAHILEGCWRGCIEPGNGMGIIKSGKDLLEIKDTDEFFIADAIIANPPSYGHIHISERLGIPLHLMFTMPWSPTTSFPHPLASMVRNDESDPHFANYVSYTMMELLAWQGLGDVINTFRERTLHLDKISPLWGHMLLSRMKVPFTYLWSSTLIPKPPDWGSHIKIAGFAFLNQATSYTPPEDLVAFLKAGPPPVYIGFGSIVVDDPKALTALIYAAVKRAGVRALVSKGWGGIGDDHPPEGVFLLGNVPHDWLFQYVSAVINHGGAGTVAAAIAAGNPTVVVPFFGDQPFWGQMIYRAGAGPAPVPFKKMTEETLSNSIHLALKPEVKIAVQKMSEQISKENGVQNAARCFQSSINMDTMRCNLCPESVAVWRIRRTNIRLSTLAAAVLVDALIINLKQLKLCRHRDWYVDEGASDPITGFLATSSSAVTGAIGLLVAYTHSISRDFNKPQTKNSKGKSTSASETSTSTADTPPHPPLTHSESIYKIPSSHPVRRAAQFSPANLDRLAHQMAMDTLPNRTDNDKRRKRILPPIRRMSSFPVTTPDHSRIYDASIDTGHLAYGVAALSLKLPVFFLYNLANGLHNAPSFILSDDTVRRRPKIKGLASGLKAAGEEFVYGLFDGITGLAIQPYLGVKKGYKSSQHAHDPESKGSIPLAVLGFAKGLGKGIGGLVCKSGAAAVGLPGYSLKGLERQLEKRRSRNLQASLLIVRIRQGIVALERSSEEERDEIMRRWKNGGFVV